MFNIFVDTHKIIASNIHEKIYDIYDIDLNKDDMLWWSVAPDILPQFKFHRHYKDESIDYIVNEIVKLIFISRYVEFNSKLDSITKKILSKKIGIISHYISDFVCLPHAERWTFATSMIKHIKYEYKLNEYASNHDFKKNIITVENIDIFEEQVIKLKPMVKAYINDVISEYQIKTGFKQDLNFALSLNLKVAYFIVDTVMVYTEARNSDFAFEF